MHTAFVKLQFHVNPFNKVDQQLILARMTVLQFLRLFISEHLVRTVVKLSPYLWDRKRHYGRIVYFNIYYNR